MISDYSTEIFSRHIFAADIISVGYPGFLFDSSFTTVFYVVIIFTFRAYVEQKGSIYNERLRGKDETFFEAIFSNEADISRLPVGKLPVRMKSGNFRGRCNILIPPWINNNQCFRKFILTIVHRKPFSVIHLHRCGFSQFIFSN